MRRRGAQGRVLLVQHNESGEKYVLKQIPISEKNAAAAVGEVNVLSRLSHPNITTLYDAWRAGSQLNILMEFADRGSLAEVIKTKQATGTLFDEDVVLDWLVQITAALRAMHALSILHRDLKAANVFLTSRNLIKVGDFGISKILERNDGLASTTIGTPYYLAPEVINGEPYGLKADVWSLGVLLYEMMALRKPFEAATSPLAPPPSPPLRRSPRFDPAVLAPPFTSATADGSQPDLNPAPPPPPPAPPPPPPPPGHLAPLACAQDCGHHLPAAAGAVLT